MKLIFVLSAFFILQVAHGQYGSKKKVFNSFIQLNDEVQSTQKSIKRNNDRMYFLLMKSEMGNQENDSVFYSDSLRLKTNEIINYINSLKVLLIVKSEKLTKSETVDHDTIINLKYIASLDDYSTPTLVLIGDRWSPNVGQYTATELYNKLNDYEQELVGFLEEENKNTELGICISYESNTANSYNWGTDNFYNMPLGGVITFLSKLQLDIRLSEAAILSHYLQKYN